MASALEPGAAIAPSPSPAAASSSSSSSSRFSKRLGIVIVTSVVQSHPSTEMMEKVVHSFSYVAGLEDCRIIIVCDGARKGEKYHSKQGRVPEAGLRNYEEYKRRLRRLCGEHVADQVAVKEAEEAEDKEDKEALEEGEEKKTEERASSGETGEVAAGVSEEQQQHEQQAEAAEVSESSPEPEAAAEGDGVRSPASSAASEFEERSQARIEESARYWANAEVVEQPERCGFGHAVLKGITMLDTEYVLVVQHDHNFDKQATVDANLILDFMSAHPANYVNIPMTTVFGHMNKCKSDYKVDVRSMKVAGPGGYDYTPILFWYDSTHFARRDYYLSVIFAPDTVVTKGAFIEDTFGHICLRELKADFKGNFHKYRMFALTVDGEKRLLFHLDGRAYLTDEYRKEKNFKPCPV